MFRQLDDAAIDFDAMPRDADFDAIITLRVYSESRRHGCIRLPAAI